MKVKASKFNDIPRKLDPIHEENEDDEDYFDKS